MTEQDYIKMQHKTINELYGRLNRTLSVTSILLIGVTCLLIVAMFYSSDCKAYGGYADSPSIYTSDGTYMGQYSDSTTGVDSINNPNGIYGSKSSATNIHNPYGIYGDSYPDHPSLIIDN